jgi:hypothetical protein
MNVTFTITSLIRYGAAPQRAATVAMDVPDEYLLDEQSSIAFAFMTLAEYAQQLVVSIATGITSLTVAQLQALLYGGTGGGGDLSVANLTVSGLLTVTGSVRNYQMGGGSPPDQIGMRSPNGATWTLEIDNAGVVQT